MSNYETTKSLLQVLHDGDLSAETEQEVRALLKANERFRLALMIYANKESWGMVNPDRSGFDTWFITPDDHVDGWIYAERALVDD